MNTYVTGEIIKSLREKKGYTQSELASKLFISEKTISKWENNRGLPDISLLEPLSNVLGISLIELFNGELVKNNNKSANMNKIKFYVCPLCGNVNISIGESIHYCCGIKLLPEDYEVNNDLAVDYIENDIYIHGNFSMTKRDYISFIAYVTPTKIEFVKLYPEQASEARFENVGKGIIYYYNNKNGLFQKKL